MEPGTIQLRTKFDWMWLALYEFIGTAIFLLGINFSNGSALVVGLSWFIAAILTGRVGGAHFNASVTVAVYIVEGKWKKNLPILFLIIVVDILGAYAGILIAMGLQQSDDPFILKPRDD